MRKPLAIRKRIFEVSPNVSTLNLPQISSRNTNQNNPFTHSKLISCYTSLTIADFHPLLSQIIFPTIKQVQSVEELTSNYKNLLQLGEKHARFT